MPALLKYSTGLPCRQDTQSTRMCSLHRREHHHPLPASPASPTSSLCRGAPGSAASWIQDIVGLAADLGVFQCDRAVPRGLHRGSCLSNDACNLAFKANLALLDLQYAQIPPPIHNRSHRPRLQHCLKEIVHQRDPGHMWEDAGNTGDRAWHQFNTLKGNVAQGGCSSRAPEWGQACSLCTQIGSDSARPTDAQASTAPW